MKSLTRITLLLTLLPLLSCGSYRAYTNPEADFGFYERVGVIPFANLTNDRNASEKVTSAFVIELLIGDALEVAPMGDVYKAARAVLKDEKTNLPDQLTGEEARALGEAAQVQALFVGAVRDYGMVRSGQEEFPLVSVSVRLIDCGTGKVVWTHEVTRKGGPKFPIFSFGETHTLGDMTAKVCREVARDFLGKVR